MSDIMKLFMLLTLVIINGFFVACEFAAVKIRVTRIDTLITDGNSKAKYVKYIKNNLNSCLSACQLGITLCSLGLGWMGEDTLTQLILPILSSIHISESIIHIVSFIISFFLITMIEVVIGELVPKALALYNTETILLNSSFLLLGFCKVMRPIIFIFDKSTDMFLRPFGYSQSGEVNDPHTDDEIRILVEESYQNGLIDETEQQLVDNIFEFGDIKIKEIMTPRTDMKCLYIEDTEEDIFNMIIGEGYTRYPVCENDKDNIIGFIHIKDLYNQKFRENEINIEKIIRKTIYVPESIYVSKLFEKMKKEKIQIAIVLDEYGGTAGIITIEDILEEIVGDIQDEFDEETPFIKKIDDMNYLIDGIAPINLVNETFGLDISNEDVDSVGGWLYTQLGSAIGEGCKLDYEGYTFIISNLDKHRVINTILNIQNKSEKGE